jgi:hypothetical protein
MMKTVLHKSTAYRLIRLVREFGSAIGRFGLAIGALTFHTFWREFRSHWNKMVGQRFTYFGKGERRAAITARQSPAGHVK